jgi:hypothetical protein
MAIRAFLLIAAASWPAAYGNNANTTVLCQMGAACAVPSAWDGSAFLWVPPASASPLPPSLLDIDDGAVHADGSTAPSSALQVDYA